MKAGDEQGQTKLKLRKDLIAQEAKMRQAIEFTLYSDPITVFATERTAKNVWAKLISQHKGSRPVLEYSATQGYVQQLISNFTYLET